MTNVSWTTLTEELRIGSHGVILGVPKGVKKGVKLKLIASLHLVIVTYGYIRTNSYNGYPKKLVQITTSLIMSAKQLANGLL